jgi:rRNA maturation protein Nop10
MPSIKTTTGSALITGKIVDGTLICGRFHCEIDGEFRDLPRPRSFSSNDQYSDASPEMGTVTALPSLPPTDKYDARRMAA